MEKEEKPYEKLLPCPACKSTNVGVDGNYPGSCAYDYAYCGDCEMRGPDVYDDEQKAAELWNKLPRESIEVPKKDHTVKIIAAIILILYILFSAGCSSNADSTHRDIGKMGDEIAVLACRYGYRAAHRGLSEEEAVKEVKEIVHYEEE